MSTTTTNNNNATLIVEEKRTKKEWFNILIDIVEKSDYIEKDGAIKMLKNEIDLIEKKAKKAKNSKEDPSTINNQLKELIKDVLTEKAGDEGLTITELLEDDRLKEYKEKQKDGTIEVKKVSSQKLSALMTQLKNDGEVKRVEEKKVAKFLLIWQ